MGVSELDVRGFMVVRSFLSPPQCAALLADFERGQPPSAYPHGFKLVGRAASATAWSVMRPFVETLRAQSDVDVDTLNFLTLSHYITTSLVERTSFLHQDFDLDYQLTGDHVNYLNFWIPIAKPDPERSNVSVVPFDSLRTRAPEAYERLHGSGGHRLVPTDGKTFVYGNYGEIIASDSGAPQLVIDADLEDIVETPSLAAGDCLIMRGDLVHRTQDASTARVSASMRVTSSKKVIRRERLRPCPPDDPASNIFKLLDRCFATHGRDAVTVGELVDLARGGSTT